VAVRTTNSELHYGELADRVTRLAESLCELTATGTLVAVESADRLSGLLALLAGGLARRAVLPVDLTYPKERRDAVLRDARPALVLREAEGGSLVADESPSEFGQKPREDLNDVAYVMYTSGSTGTPKGVVVSHQALADRIAGLARTPGLAAGESILALTVLSFDPSFAELLVPLQVGGTVIAVGPEVRTDPELFIELVDTLRPDVVQATPSFLRLVLRAGWDGLPHGRIWSGGEELTSPLASRLLPRSKELWNVYGPTETTIWATAQLIVEHDAVCLGDPLPGTGIHLDPNVSAVNASADSDGGIEGEILIYGTGLARGYLDRDELTADRFVEFPLPHGTQRCYRTGDLGRRRADGSLQYLGRIDGQVKIRGHRVELGDIEAAFESNAAVGEAVAVFLPDDDELALPAEVVVSVVLASSEQSSARELRGWAAERLPRQLLPTHIHIRDELPRTPTGKADRREIQVMLANQRVAGAGQ
jgi:amino acid adenylation domain-containing protein